MDNVPVAHKIPITVLTSDTFGTARQVLELENLPVAVETAHTGRDKAQRLSDQIGVVAIGNGHNDIAMTWLADLTAGSWFPFSLRAPRWRTPCRSCTTAGSTHTWPMRLLALASLVICTAVVYVI